MGGSPTRAGALAPPLEYSCMTQEENRHFVTFLPRSATDARFEPAPLHAYRPRLTRRVPCQDAFSILRTSCRRSAFNPPRQAADPAPSFAIKSFCLLNVGRVY